MFVSRASVYAASGGRGTDRSCAPGPAGAWGPHAGHSARGRRRPGTGRPGAHVVEMAFVAPIFFMLVLGIIEIGRGLMVINLLNDAARMSCRKGALGLLTSSQIQSEVQQTLAAVNIPISTSNVTVAVNSNAGTALNSSTPSGAKITVTVSAPVSAVTWVPGGGFLTGNLSGRSTSRKE